MSRGHLRTADVVHFMRKRARRRLPKGWTLNLRQVKQRCSQKGPLLNGPLVEDPQRPLRASVLLA